MAVASLHTVPRAAPDRTGRWDRTIVCALLAVPVVALSVVPAWQFPHWTWIQLTLAAPVVVWGGWPVHRRAVVSLGSGRPGACVPVALGVVGALGWSLYGLLAGPAGDPGWSQTFGPDGSPVRLDVAAGATLAFLAAGLVASPAVDRAARVPAVVVPLVLAVAAGTLGYRLGSGTDPATAVGAALAVLLVAAPSAFRTGSSPDIPDPAGTAPPASDERTLAALHLRLGTRRDDVLRLAGAVAAHSAHPAARAVAAAADGPLPAVAEPDERPGLGVTGLVAELRGDELPRSATDEAGQQGAGGHLAGAASEPSERVTVVTHAVVVGRPALLAEHGIPLPAPLERARAEAEAGGATAVVVAWDGHARAVLTIARTPTAAAHAGTAPPPSGAGRWLLVCALAYHLVALPAAALGIVDPLLAGAAGALVTAAARTSGRRGDPEEVRVGATDG